MLLVKLCVNYYVFYLSLKIEICHQTPCISSFDNVVHKLCYHNGSVTLLRFVTRGKDRNL